MAGRKSALSPILFTSLLVVTVADLIDGLCRMAALNQSEVGPTAPLIAMSTDTEAFVIVSFLLGCCYCSSHSPAKFVQRCFTGWFGKQ